MTPKERWEIVKKQKVCFSCLKFVDDIFATWSYGKEHLDRFLNYLNNIHPSIKFTIQHKDDKHSLFFLDIALTRNHDGTLNHAVFRKPTHTDRYLNYQIVSSPCN